MEVRRVEFHAVLPVKAEMLDTTNRRIRRILDFVVFYDEQDISMDDLDMIVETFLTREEPYVFPDGDEEFIYTMDDLVFVAPHRARLHFSRPLTA